MIKYILYKCIVKMLNERLLGIALSVAVVSLIATMATADLGKCDRLNERNEDPPYPTEAKMLDDYI